MIQCSLPISKQLPRYIRIPAKHTKHKWNVHSICNIKAEVCPAYVTCRCSSSPDK
uniref:Uncharacterized protein n=1 Tax=Anguilla anguilla TaxID=7936 RepID=A0A0E9Q112_ANGAN